MKKIVYVTGCLGFIGMNLTRKLLIKGWYVIGVDKISPVSNLQSLNEFKHYPNFTFIHSDISDLKFLYDCDYIINTAAESHVDNSIEESDEFVKSNINGVHNLLKQISKKKTRPILVHFSTDEVYGDISEGFHTEQDLLKPSNPYSATKAAADMLIIAWARTHEVQYKIVRPTNNYGVGQYVEKLIPKAIKCLNLGRKIPLHQHGTPKRTWLHVDDTCSAVMTVIEKGTMNNIYNISGNYEDTNLQVVQKIIDIYHGKQENYDQYLDFSFHRPGQDVRYAIDDSKLKRHGWKPISIFDEELESIVKYYRKHFIW